MSRTNRIVAPTLLLLAVAGGVGGRATAQALPDPSQGYIVVLEPREWQSEGFRGIEFAGRPVRVVGTAHHPSGIDRVTVNGTPAAVTVVRSGATRWVATISAAAATRAVEIVAYPRQGSPIVRVQNAETAVRHSGTSTPSIGGAPGPLLVRGQPLRVGLAALPASGRTALLASLRDDPAIVPATADPDVQLRAADGEYLVVGRDGSIRHRVPAPNAAAGAAALVDVLVREQGALQLAALASPARTFGVTVSFPRGSEFRVGEGIEFRVRAERAGYVTLVDLGTDGTLAVLFPFSSDDAVSLPAGQELLLPNEAARAQFAPDPPYKASLPVGTGMVRAFVTPRPLVLPDPASGPLSADVLLRAVQEATAGGEPWATAVLNYRIVR